MEEARTCGSTQCCLFHWFEAVATRNPDRIAIVHATSRSSGSYFGSDAADKSSRLGGANECRGSGDQTQEQGGSERDVSTESAVESVPIYPGDVTYTYGELLGAVDELTQRISSTVGKSSSSHGATSSKGSIRHGERLCIENEENGSPINICILAGHSAEYMVAVLAVLKFGAVFVSLDPFWPVRRILAILDDCDPCLVIYYQYSFSFLSSNFCDIHALSCSVKVPVLCLPEGFAKSIKRSKGIQEMSKTMCHTKVRRPYCYIMYTSGSTGKPKGVCGTERGLLHRLQWMELEYPYLVDDVALFKTSIAFIDHLTESLGPLLGNTPLVVPPPKGLLRNPLGFLPYMRAYRISRLTTVPSLMRALLPALQGPEGKAAVMSLHILVLSGEILHLWLWKALCEAMWQVTILNLYGSTELSGDCFYFDCRSLLKIADSLPPAPKQSVPIGRPIPGCEFFIAPDIDDATSCPKEGELYVGGEILAFGYFNDALSTNEKFVYASSLGNGSLEGDSKCQVSSESTVRRMFKTGDYVMKLEDGNCIVIGRRDRMIKINGQRIALEEVERNLEQHPNVVCAAASYFSAENEDNYLVAYIVTKEQDQLISADSEGQEMNHDSDLHSKTCIPAREDLQIDLRSWMRERLPSVMTPQIFFQLHSLPIVASGKVDYQALPKSIFQKPNLELVLGTEQEQARIKYIQKVFERALKGVNISISEDFFLSGGTSISAAHVAHILGIDMGLLYQHRSAMDLEPVLRDAEKTRGERKRDLKDEDKPVEDIGQKRKCTKKDPFLDMADYEKFEDQGTSRNLDASLNTKYLEDKKMKPKFSLNQIHDSSINVASDCIVKKKTHGSGQPLVQRRKQDYWPYGIDILEPTALLRCNRLTCLGPACRTSAPWNPCNLMLPSPTINQPVHLSIQWQISLKSCVDASPVLLQMGNNGQLFIGSHAHLFVCVDTFCGKLKWETMLGGRIESTAAITRDFAQVVVGCYDGSIYILDCENGTILWKFQTGGEVKCQPTVDGRTGLIWCGSHDHNLYVLDASQKICVWKYDCGGSVFGAPAHDMVRGISYIATTSGSIIAARIGAVAEIIWTYSCGAPIFGSPTVDPFTGYVIGTLVSGRVIALTSSGSLSWESMTNGPIFGGACISSALPCQVLVCSRDGWIYSFRVTDGQCLWKHHIGEPITSSAFVDEGIELTYKEYEENVVNYHKFRIVCACGTSGSLHVLKIYSYSMTDLSSGDPNFLSDTSTTPRKNSCCIEDVGKEKSQIYNQSEKVIHQIAYPNCVPTSLPACENFATLNLPGDVFSSPVMLGSRIFLGCRDNNLYCIEVTGLKE